jgi:hypothetical protein
MHKSQGVEPITDSRLTIEGGLAFASFVIVVALASVESGWASSSAQSRANFLVAAMVLLV